MVTKVTIQPNIDDTSASRLEARGYEKSWTNIPNRVLSPQVKEAWGAFYRQTGLGEFDQEGSIYTVRAADGQFKGIVAPSVFRAASYSEDGEAELHDFLVLRIGDSILNLDMTPGQMLPGMKTSIRTVKNGKWEETAIVATFKDSGVLYTFQFPLRSADWSKKIDPELMESLLEEGSLEVFLNLLQPLPSTKKGEGGGERLQGPFVKVSLFPIGDYRAVAYRARETDYGTDYLIQVIVDEPFLVGTGEEEQMVQGFAIMKPNNALKKVFGARPTISNEQPAIISVLEHGEWNGHQTAKVAVKITSFEDSNEDIDLNF